MHGDPIPQEAGHLSLATELNANAHVQGSFSGHFENKQEAYLEKADLTCIDQYSYGTVTHSSNGHIERKASWTGSAPINGVEP